MMRELLIATTNKGKEKEIKTFLETMPFTFLSLADLKETIQPPKEIGETLSENALLKARHYAEKTGYLTLADDTGIFIDALGGWPGVMSARVSDTSEGRVAVIAEKVKTLAADQRQAIFKTYMALVDPLSKVDFLVHGEAIGEMLDEPGGNGFGFCFDYDVLFYSPEVKKVFSELTINEKNSVSHRSRALIRVKHHLQNTYVPKHMVVPFGLIIKDGKVLMSLRNDPHRPEYHNKWEFPGGKVEFGETMHENMIREVKEEVGYDVKIIKMLQHIAVESQVQKTYAYQIFLVPYVCAITGGEEKISDSEVLETRWFDPDDILNHDMIGENSRMYRYILPELKENI